MSGMTVMNCSHVPWPSGGDVGNFIIQSFPPFFLTPILFGRKERKLMIPSDFNRYKIRFEAVGCFLFWNFDKSSLSHLILTNKVQELELEATPFGDFKQGQWEISRCTSTQREAPPQKFSYKSFQRAFMGHRLSYDRYRRRSRRVQGAS